MIKLNKNKMDLEQQFNKETGRKSYNTINCCYDGYYVEWLEERIKQLTIPVVSSCNCLADKVTVF